VKYIKSTIEMLVWSVMFGAIYVQPVSAYLDPGGGSLIIQFLLASIVGILFVIRQFWGRIISFIKRFVVSDVDSDYKQDTDSNND